MTDLVFRALIESIDCAPIGISGAFLDWVVRTRVEQVVSGEFAGTHFAFRVHSPSRAGLVVGMRCTVTAIAIATGYRVDEHQWHGHPT